MSTFDGGRKIALGRESFGYDHHVCGILPTIFIPVVDFLVSEDVTDEPDAGDEVHEDGKESEAVPPRLPRHL